MAIAALITWLITAAGGSVMFGIWIARGGLKGKRSHLPPSVIFSHLGLAVISLLVWIVYVFTDNHAIAWTGFALLVPVALLGFVMLVRWLPARRAHVPAAVGGIGTTGAPPPENHFPVGAVIGHGVFALATVVLALLAALEF